MKRPRGLDATSPAAAGYAVQSGAFALALGVLFLLSAFLNVVLPHYERVEYSVQTRCQITEAKEDELIDERLMHMKVPYFFSQSRCLPRTMNERKLS